MDDDSAQSVCSVQPKTYDTARRGTIYQQQQFDMLRYTLAAVESTVPFPLLPPACEVLVSWSDGAEGVQGFGNRGQLRCWTPAPLEAGGRLVYAWLQSSALLV